MMAAFLHPSLYLCPWQTELTFCAGDIIAVFGDIDEDGFYYVSAAHPGLPDLSSVTRLIPLSLHMVNCFY